MEIIENTNYNNEIPIITEEDKNIYTICISPENLARFEKMAETCSDIEIRRNL